MADSIKVSVLITFYNKGDYVDRAIDSVIGQQVDFPIEILAGDDGSNDETPERLAIWQQRYPDLIKVYRWDRTIGATEPIARASANRLALLERASGEYVVFLDGDDYFSDNQKLKRQVVALDQHQECASCCHNMLLRSSDGRSSFMMPDWMREGTIGFRTFWSLYYVSAEAFLFKKSEFIAADVDEDNFDDNTIVFLLARRGRVYYMPEAMAVYEQGETGSWLGRSEAERAMANLRDYIYEVSLCPRLKAASRMRHIVDLRWLANRALTVDQVRQSCEAVRFLGDLEERGLHSDQAGISVFGGRLLMLRIQFWRVGKKLMAIGFKVKNTL